MSTHSESQPGQAATFLGKSGRGWGWPVLLAMSVLVMGGGCYERVVNDPWAAYRELGMGGGEGGQGGMHLAGESQDQRRWTIRLTTLKGSGRDKRAAQLIERLFRQTGWQDVWSQEVDRKVHVYRGRFFGPDEPEAQYVLSQTQSLSLEQGPDLAKAELVSLDPDGGVMSPMNLKAHRGRDLYSLQIAFYDQQFGEDFRDAAEQAAQVLREEGEEAYFFHGATMSMVTIGLFDESDFERHEPRPGTFTRRYGPRIKALREEYPYNLSNGRTMLRQLEGGGEKIEPSRVVRVP